MHNYVFSVELARIALVVGVVVSILFYERVQLTTGGAIVPPYLTLFLLAPLHVLTTLVVAYATYVLVSVVIAKRWILYGRRKFEVEVLVGLAIVAVLTVVARALGRVNPFYFGLSGVGFLIPAVLAHDMFRQKPKKTFFAVGATTAILSLIVFVVGALMAISPAGRDITDVTDAAVDLTASTLREGALGYPIDLVVLGAIASVLAGLVTFSRLGLRAGGFITGAYLALVLTRPLDLVFAATVTVLTWALVTKLVMPHLLVFGRRKLSTMILVGGIVAWSAEVLVTVVTDGGYRPWRGFVLMTLMVPALLANDAQRQGLERTVWGAGISALGVFGVMNVLWAGLLAVGLL